jgi:hypothetical protein
MNPTKKAKAPQINARTAAILKGLRDARKAAVKSAQLHGVPIIYRKAGKLVRERP